MNKSKSFIVLLLGAILLMSSACKSGYISNRVVATVNSETVTYSEFLQEMNDYALYYGYETLDAVAEVLGEEQYDEFKMAILDQLVSQIIMRQRATYLGLDQFTQEEEASFSTMAQEYYDYILESFRTELGVTSDQSAEDAALNAQAEQKAKEYLESVNLDMDTVVDMYREEAIYNALYKHVVDTVQITPEQVQEKYDELLALQKIDDESDPQQALENFYYGAYEVNVYMPSALGRTAYVRHILIPFPNDLPDQIKTLRQKGSTSEANALRTDSLPLIQEQADTVLALAVAGNDFEKLISEYGTDPGMKDDYYLDGYEVVKDSDFHEEFETASLALSVGEISTLVVTDDGYHIIKCISERQPGAIALDEVAADIEVTALSAQQQATWNEQL